MVTQTVSERIIGVVPEVSRRKGLSGKEFFKLLVTDKHLVFSPQPTKETGKSADQIPIKIETSQVKSIVLNVGSSFVNCCGKLIEEDGSLRIETSEKKYSFSLSHRYAKIADNILHKAGLIKDQPAGAVHT